MTKRELVEALKEYDDDMPMIVPGHEQGLDDLLYAYPVTINRNVHNGGVYGKHEFVGIAHMGRNVSVATAAVLLKG